MCQPSLSYRLCKTAFPCLQARVWLGDSSPLAIAFFPSCIPITLYLMAEPRERVMCAEQAWMQCIPAHEGQ